MSRLLAFLLLFPTVLAARPTRQNASGGNIARFSTLSDGLYRGGQPTADGFRFLKEKGIKTVINLRAEDNRESNVVEGLGMNYVQIPVDETRPWSQIPPSAIAKYFELINNPENYPIFFHCKRGADRTGAFAAMYRMAIQGWNAQQAYGEARNVGMRWYYGGLKSQLYDFHPPADRAQLQSAIQQAPEK
jgi:protein tyrosine/serine phosphatase